MSIRLNRRVVGKSTSFTPNLNSDIAGTTFTNLGATGPITCTLPAPNAKTQGLWYRIAGVVDQNIIVATAVADTLVVLNDATADSMAIQTAGQKIGAEIEVIVLEVTPGVFRWRALGLGTGFTYTLAT